MIYPTTINGDTNDIPREDYNSIFLADSQHPSSDIQCTRARFMKFLAHLIKKSFPSDFHPNTQVKAMSFLSSPFAILTATPA
jgi:hypothetical protein